MKIGVFDSGYGGRVVAKRLQLRLPEHEFLVVDDTAHMPYGNRQRDEIRILTDRAIQPLLTSCPLIVVACNTATAHAIDWLRHKYPETIFVGYEPMLKPARELTKSRHITMCATAATVASERYVRLANKYASDMMIDTPNTSDWAKNIENGRPDAIDLSKIEHSIASGSDVIVLACTHYLALENDIRIRWPQAHVIEPTPAVAERIMQLIA